VPHAGDAEERGGTKERAHAGAIPPILLCESVQAENVDSSAKMVPSNEAPANRP
jgi:hypothetical protein